MLNLKVSEIYEQFAEPVFKYFYVRVENQALAEDLTSLTFVRIVKKISTYNEKKAKLSTWIFTIARNILVDYFRRKAERVEFPMGEDNSDSSDVSCQDNPLYNAVAENLCNKTLEYDVQMDRNKDILNSELLKLSDKEQHIIDLRFTQELSYEEIAQILGLTVNTVGVRLHRAIDKLKNNMTKSGNIFRVDLPQNN